MERRVLLCLLSGCLQLALGAPGTPVLSVTPGKKGPNTFLEGDTLTASCKVADVQPGTNIRWFIKNWELDKNLSQVLTTKERGLNTITQDLTHLVDSSDNGKGLRCVVPDSPKEDVKSSNEFKLNVLYSPKPESQSYERSLPRLGFGEPWMLHARVFANPRPNFYWMVDGERIRDGEKDKKGQLSARSSDLEDGMWKATLNIARLAEEHLTKKYTLTASNEWGQEVYTFNITDKVVFTWGN